MNEAIETLALQIVAMTLRITAAGQYHAFANQYGHVRTLDVHVYPATTEYTSEVPRKALAATSTYWEPSKHSHLEAEEQLPTVIAELEAVIAKLQPYMPQTPAISQEAAA